MSSGSSIGSPARALADTSASGISSTRVLRSSTSLTSRPRSQFSTTWSVMIFSALSFAALSVIFVARPRTTTDR